MINSVTLVGRITKDLDLKYTQGGVAICRFTVACNRPFKNAEGNNEADFPNIVTFRKTAENAANFLRKGSLVGITGRIQTSSFDGKGGNRVFMTEVVADSVQFLEPKSSNTNNAPNNQYNGGQQSGYTNTPNQSYNGGNQQNMANNGMSGQAHEDPFATNAGPLEISDDDLPF